MIQKNVLTRMAHQKYWRTMEDRLERVAAVRDVAPREQAAPIIPPATLYAEPGGGKRKRAEEGGETAKVTNDYYACFLQFIFFFPSSFF